MSIADPGATGRQIVEVALDGTRVVSYTTQSGWQDLVAASSPDGTELAFIRMNTDTGDERMMVRGALDGASPVLELWRFDTNEQVVSIRWISNDRMLVSSVDGQGQISNLIWNYHTRVGSGTIGLGAFATADPLGTRVAWLQGTGASYDLFVSRLDGSAPTRLTDVPAAREYINWSADGQAIVYVTIVTTLPTTMRLEMVVLPPLL
jgi:Tol biopolymer transport system component